MTNFPKARIEDYGFKNREWLAPLLKWVGILFFVLMMFMLYLPIIIIAIQSVNSSVVTTRFSTFTLEWYTNIFNEDELLNAIKNTLMVSAIATTLATVLGTFFAIGIFHLPKNKRSGLMFLNNVPILNADIVTGFSLMIMFRFVMVLINMVVQLFNPSASISIFGLPTLVLAHLFFTFPYVVLSVVPKLKELDANLVDAAADLGLKPMKALIYVVVPAIKAGIFSGMLLALTMSVDDFVISFFNTGAGYDNLSIWIYGVLGRRNLTPSVYAFSTLLTILTMVGLIGSQFMNKKGKTNK
ncbi:ABC transporter permease [Acholeplasma manati]|uniref:ABC transporter permease n=1 Tax=Paracholeplasma manati TaxID=591373 RepID=A0ABT2Y793_9MOLU|nr:ABC transporter permease [Paracholeplasma manati]MCV2232612.1 ABC transporter permease [Paracholeplasma manati]